MTQPLLSAPDGCQHPTLILIIPQSALERMAPAITGAIAGCEAQYHAGTYYIEVPPDRYQSPAWAEMEWSQ